MCHVLFELLLVTTTGIMANRSFRVILWAVLLFFLWRFASTLRLPINTTSSNNLSDDIVRPWVVRYRARLWFLERCVYILLSTVWHLFNLILKAVL